MALSEYEDAIDTTLIPLGTQYGATLSKGGKGNPSKYAAFAIPCTPQQRLSDHSYRAGQWFESARRLSFFPAKPAKTKSPDVRVAGFVSSRLYLKPKGKNVWRNPISLSSAT
jgi:hypothetical protein